MKKDKAVIVGGGITGLCSAYYLLEAGWEVTLVDKSDLTDNCSFGNAGMIVPSHFVPLAAPGVISQGIRWLFDKKSPFFLDFSFDWSLIRWLWQFLKHANQNHVNDSAQAILNLNRLGKEEYQKLNTNGALDFSLSDKGILMLYKTEATEKEQLDLAEKAQAMQMDCKVLTKSEIQALESEVSVAVKGGVLYKSDAWLHPPQVMENLLKVLKEKGLVVHPHQSIKGMETIGKKITRIYSEDNTYSADKFIFTAGADLEKLVKPLGLKIPVLPGKGYSFMTDDFEGKLRYAALLLDHKISITPMGKQVRIGGTMELGKKNLHVRKPKIEGMVQAVNHYYPGRNITEPDIAQVWQGFRPCSPDGLPYIGVSGQFDNLIIAGGAGMMGMSCGPAFGKLVCQLTDERQLSMNIDRFLPERFN